MSCLPRRQLRNFQGSPRGKLTRCPPYIRTLNISHRGGEWGVEGQSGAELNCEWSHRLALFDLSAAFQVPWPL